MYLCQYFSFCQMTFLMKRCSRAVHVLTSLDVGVRDGGRSPISINQLWSCAALRLECHLWGHPVIPARRAWHALTTSTLVGGGEGGERGCGVGSGRGGAPLPFLAALAHEGGFNRGWWGGIKWKRGLESLSGSRWRSRG